MESAPRKSPWKPSDEDSDEAYCFVPEGLGRGGLYLPLQVIMDISVLGGMTDKEAVRHILDMEPEAKVIVSSGYSYDPIMADYKAHGFMGVMPKPYSLVELSHILSEMLED